MTHVYIIYSSLCPEKYYIGSTHQLKKRADQHFSNLKNNTHICIELQKAYNTLDKDTFLIGIMGKYQTIEQCRKEEQKQLDHLWDLGVLYNGSKKASGGDLISYHPNRAEIIRKISETLRNKWAKLTVEERKVKFGKAGEANNMYGKHHTEETKEKISNNLSEYYKTHDSSNLGKKVSEETKEKMSISAPNRVGELNPFYGKHHTEETKEKLRVVHTGKISTCRKKVSIEGVIYASHAEASKAIGCALGTIGNRIRSQNPLWKNYKSVEE